MKAWVAAGLALFFLFTPRAAAQPTDTRLALAREVIELSGGLDSMGQMLNAMQPQMLADLRQRGVSDEDAALFISYFIEEFRQDGPQMIELMARTYADRFSEADLESMRAFWASHAGQALREATPELAAAMMGVGMQLGQEAGLRAAERMTEDQRRRLSGS